MSDGRKSHGSHAAALRAVRFASELAGHNLTLEIGGDGTRGLRKMHSAGEDGGLRYSLINPSGMSSFGYRA